MIRMCGWLSVMVVVLYSYFACSPVIPSCVSGKVEACPCPNGKQGSQMCLANGVWGVCKCKDGGTSTDAGVQDKVAPKPDLPVVDTTPSKEDKVTQPDKPTKAQICFKRDILPIFVSNCAMSGCHDSISREEDIDLSNYRAIMSSDDGEGIVPGRPDKSEIMESILESKASKRMPPPPRPPLSAKDIQLLQRWIREGARNTPCAKPTQCPTTQRSYAKHIQPLMKKYCTGCHNQASPQGNVDLAGLEKVKKYGKSGLLIKVITHAPDAKAMPPGNKMPDCEIKQVRAWIQQEYTP